MELIAKLEAAPHGGRDAIVDAAAAFVGKSKTTVYRALRKLGYNTQRKPRADKGTSVISDDELASIAAIQHAATRKTGKRLASAKTAVEIAAANGLAARQYSPSTVNRQLRERGLSGAQMRRAAPHVQLASRHPNHMWQIDPSYCVLYYLKAGKGLAVMDEAQFYKNKPHNFAKIARDRVLRYVCVDHCTGAFYCRYYNVSGENAETMFDFLMRAMGEKDKQHNPFEGVPKILYWDKGSANQSSLILSLLEGLGIEHHAHVKGNSRAKGSVEKHNDIIETNFESRLTFAHIESIEQLNAACERWQRHFQATHVHSRHGMTRFAAWRKITPEQLIARPPLELCRVLLTGKAEQRTVGGDYHISYAIPGYGSSRYRVADVDNIRIGETVTVQVNPYAAPSIWVSHPDRYGKMQRYEIAPLEVDDWGFAADAVPVDGHFQQAPDDVLTTNRKTLDEMAWGTRDAQEVDRLRNSKSAPAFGGALNPFTALAAPAPGKTMHFPRNGRPREIATAAPQQLPVNPLFVPAPAAPREERILPVMDFIRYCAREMTVTPELNAEIRATYPDGLPESAFEDALKCLLQPTLFERAKEIA
ncbi:hypothetical protein [Cardiobacterium hominis]|uniref:hypothetical protein n=1 Tax=Cardiobacterium hominis TaxID=2718 RepID=UPI00288B8512|nr:hypothetical protein [Cardiobacterium hominis]